MATARLVPVLVFLSFCPTLSGRIPGGSIGMITPRAISFLKGVNSGMKWYDRSKKVEDLFQNLGVVTSPNSEKALSVDDIDEGMFAFEFGVGVPPQQVTGLLSISSLLTWISGYQPSRNVSCCAFTKDNDICCAECGATCQSYQGYYLVSDRFTFSNIGYLDSYFEGSPMGNNSAGPIGIISFSLSSYSVVSNLRTKQFSYFFSFNSTKNSSILLGDSVSSIPRTGLQAAQLIGYPNYYTHLYFVNLAQISFGNKYVAIYPETDFANGVILDTIIPVTLLAEPAYKKLKSEIMAQIGQPVANPSNSFDMCYRKSTHWPNLTLSFSGPSGYSGYAKMVLRKENYVVTDDDAGLECVAIFPTSKQGFSVIGSMAQLDRQMIFDVEQSTLYFDQYPDISSDTKLAIQLNLVVVYFTLLLLCW
ncbi:putative aspartic proteinase nepenthesin I [Carex littledalei]|uniref:Putative aspartic proteinase nepenthesin I n=1 Tax=Carex littledalei TaxID=544730 RepID=A0A833R9X7_9POAL|nr:putative aspartic proteinase nepenthesin I [Carex littledalei]